MLRFSPIFLSVIFLSLHYAAILYVNSSYLGKFFSSDTVSVLFLLGALGNIGFLFLGAKLIRVLGPKILLILLLIVIGASTLAIGYSTDPVTIAMSFVVYGSVLFMAYWSLDIFLEELTSDTNTGAVRGAYLTSQNSAIAVAPLILAVFADSDDLRPLYLASALLLTPPILICILFLKQRKVVRKGPIAKLPFAVWWKRVNIRRITIARFVLEFFYTFMVIYTPIYLHNYVGFNWRELGFMFTIMLLPFVIFEWPAGEIGDRKLGEKEILFTGFFIIIGTLLLMPHLGKVFAVWTAVLFMSRVGASLIEIATESYFFKKVTSADAGLISVFRLSRPFSIILGAVVGAISLKLLDFQYIFLVLAVVMIFGFAQTLRLRDTK